MTFYCGHLQTFAKVQRFLQQTPHQLPSIHQFPILLRPSPRPHQTILINCFFPNLLLTNPTHKSPMGSPGVKLIPETGNHCHWVSSSSSKTGGSEGGQELPEGRKPNTAPLLCKVLRAPHCSSPAAARQQPGTSPAPAPRPMLPVYVFCQLSLMEGWFMFPGAGVSFYFCAVISPLQVLNSSARFESTHSLLFLVCEWPEIVSIVIDLNFHFDDGNKYFSCPSLKQE